MRDKYAVKRGQEKGKPGQLFNTPAKAQNQCKAFLRGNRKGANLGKHLQTNTSTGWKAQTEGAKGEKRRSKSDSALKTPSDSPKIWRQPAVSGGGGNAHGRVERGIGSCTGLSISLKLTPTRLHRFSRGEKVQPKKTTLLVKPSSGRVLSEGRKEVSPTRGRGKRGLLKT